MADTLRSGVRQAERKAVALVKAMMGIVPLIPQPNGKDERPVAFLRRHGVSYMARCKGKGLWTGTPDEYVSGTQWCKTPQLRVALTRLCQGELAREMGREVVGIYWNIDKFHDSISRLLVLKEMVASGFDHVFFLATSISAQSPETGRTPLPAHGNDVIRSC